MTAKPDALKPDALRGAIPEGWTDDNVVRRELDARYGIGPVYRPCPLCGGEWVSLYPSSAIVLRHAPDCPRRR
jgi:hypothetical protein